MLLILLVSQQLFFRFLGPHEIPKYSHFLMKVVHEIKPKLLSQPKLAIVVIETFSRDSCNFGSILEIQPFSLVGSTMSMQISPLFHNIKHLSYGPLSTFLLNEVTAGI